MDGGQERREGLPSGWRLGNCGAREAAVAPEFPGTPQIKHTATEQQGSTQRENGKEEGAAGQRGSLGKQRPLYGSRGKVLGILEYAQRVSVYWFSLLAGGGEITGERGDGVMIVAREV